ncbi:MAG: pyruvate kinase [Planctomycetota bacterium]|nr:pyruvate kinase [Planctomycetota bacterium]
MPLECRTKIIATLGPASRHPEVISEMVRAGVDCFRINFSHSDGPAAMPMVETVRAVCRQQGRFIPILADIQGPKLRVGKVPAEGLLLREGAPFTLTGRAVPATDVIVQSQYEQLAQDVRAGTVILLADGTIELRVESVEGQDVLCRVTSGGRLYSNKGINIPHTKLSVETLTEKDRRDLRFIAGSGIDMVAISFVRTPDDIHLARQILGPNSHVPVLAKLELPEVLNHLDAIFEVSDGVMVARGDLGVEVPFERVPPLQKQILARATERGKWAVVATQMLGSMVLNNRPTRAEVSDVANAVLDGADAMMMSEETATGDHPLEAVQAMVRIAREAEAMADPTRAIVQAAESTFRASAANAAVNAAKSLRAPAIIALAGSGLTALAVSKWRPGIPILALSAKEATLRRLNVLRGVMPVPLTGHLTMEEQIHAADAYLLKSGLAEVGQPVVIVGALPLGHHRETNTIRFHRVRAHQ